jgi:hypothetical protein
MTKMFRPVLSAYLQILNARPRAHADTDLPFVPMSHLHLEMEGEVIHDPSWRAAHDAAARKDHDEARTPGDALVDEGAAR